MKFDNLKRVLSKFVSVKEEDLKLFISTASEVHLKKNEYWEQEGRIGKNMGFVEKGALKESYLKNGNELINNFFIEGDFIGNYISYDNNEASKTSTIAIENTIIYSVPFEEFHKIAMNAPDMQLVSKMVGEKKLYDLNERSRSLLMDTPEERYEQFVQQRPELINRFPQYMIAQYLGIKPESLSRIRKKRSS